MFIHLSDEVVVGVSNSTTLQRIFEQDDVGIKDKTGHLLGKNGVNDHQLHLHENVEIVISIVARVVVAELLQIGRLDQSDRESLLAKNIVRLLVNSHHHEVGVSPQLARHVQHIELVQVGIIRKCHIDTIALRYLVSELLDSNNVIGSVRFAQLALGKI